ncbi:MAG: hypothetical protein WBA57_07605 [Elainellaceae cyanobacterium]
MFSTPSQQLQSCLQTNPKLTVRTDAQGAFLQKFVPETVPHGCTPLISANRICANGITQPVDELKSSMA